MLAYIIRGCPGSGKSTLAKQLAEKHGGRIHSSDNYFNVTGEYLFNPNRLGKFHQLNKEDFELSLKQGINAFCDNTNTTWKEIKPYVDIAKKYNADIIIAEPTTSWRFDVEELFKRNTHDVPKETIQAMLDRWESTEDIIRKI